MQPAIRVDNIGKRYKIGLRAKATQTFREALVGMAAAPMRRLRALGESASEEETIWALRNVSLEVKPGEVVGVIGRNGAGKSTLLKILSGITEPTEGRIELRGRVASLLEVGTGFHPELTGRENVFLNGAILGMRKVEIVRRFDEIVAFAEIEKFLDTPVKRYSSGMYVRLAFAVAAHLEPEILLVDEVLAVGDFEFQSKCLGKMRDVATGGRTVLFVSHNMSAIQTLCETCCLVEGGRLALRGSTGECIAQYVGQNQGDNWKPTVSFSRPSGVNPWMTSATLLCNGAPSTSLSTGDELGIEIAFASEYPMRYPRVGFVVSTLQGERVLNGNNGYQASPRFAEPVARGRVRCELGMVPLMAEGYAVSLWFGDGNQPHDSHVVEHALCFEVTEKDIWGQGKVPPRRVGWMWWPTKFQLRPEGVEAVSGD